MAAGELASPLPHLEDAVVRVTRPDGSTRGERTIYRFKERAALQRELYATLHASANGTGVACRAAFLFPALERGGVMLYGSCFVLECAATDADAALDRQQQEIERRGLEGPAREQALRGVGASVACRVLPLVHRMSALGAVSADCKPSNIVFTEADAARAIDFDANMFALLTPAACEWPVCMLHNVALLSAHVRAFRPAPLADGWAAAVRPLVLDLCRYEREQLAAARARRADGARRASRRGHRRRA